MLPAIAGLWLALLSITDTQQLQHLIRASRKGRQAIGNIVRSRKANFQRSTTNVSRSMGISYRGSIASKVKYRSIFQSLTRLYNPHTAHRSTIHVMPDVAVDYILSYDRLQGHLRSIDVGVLRPLPEVDGATPVDGLRRSLESLLLIMAGRVWSAPHLREALSWPQGEGHFPYPLGGDGAPLNKSNDITLMMVSFLNSGARELGSGEVAPGAEKMSPPESPAPQTGREP